MDNHIIIDIPEAQIDFSDASWKDKVKQDFRDIQNTLESRPDPSSPTYYTWFWFFMRYGKALCSQEGRNYLTKNNLSAFDFVKDVVGLTMSGGGAYTIGYKFYESCILNSQGTNASGITFFKHSPKNQDLGTPLQEIYYGAPGTGKSHEVKRITGEQNDESLVNVFRTTFHPDTDYATFVGCYKPTMEETKGNKQAILDYESLVDKFKEYLAVTPINITKACTMFGHDYHDSIVRLEGFHSIQDLVSDAYKSGSTYDSQVRAGMAIYEASSQQESSNKTIVYEFVPQAFTDAYVYAYNHADEPTYLVIEEINRGNCAQIFGDLFQLLDRKADGTSEYTIKADKDLANYLTAQLGEDSEGIKDGKLRLPANLNILATMNTSDQSLFPMDSAFKRRWDWKYVAISYTEPKSSSFIINVGEGYNWVDFIEQVNERIFSLTQSEDKQLGNFFIKDSIDADQFKSKVMFYLWYEVLRDEVENSKYFFYYTTTDETGKENNHKFTFKDLYGDNANDILEGFLKYITKKAE